jgi:2,4-dienoyl-CoA reductase-like NADH-dependent reductase (Old Yellow Enzyme family)
MTEAVPPIFGPLQLRSVTIANPIAMAPMDRHSAAEDLPNDWHLVHLRSRAVRAVWPEAKPMSARISAGAAAMSRENRAVALTRNYRDARVRLSGPVDHWR